MNLCPEASSGYFSYVSFFNLYDQPVDSSGYMKIFKDQSDQTTVR